MPPEEWEPYKSFVPQCWKQYFLDSSKAIATKSGTIGQAQGITSQPGSTKSGVQFLMNSCHTEGVRDRNRAGIEAADPAGSAS
eukprot:gene22762-biopygen1962